MLGCLKDFIWIFILFIFLIFLGIFVFGFTIFIGVFFGIFLIFGIISLFIPEEKEKREKDEL
jgi:predicted membrane protein